jgi:hypothetical protein
MIRQAPSLHFDLIMPHFQDSLEKWPNQVKEWAELGRFPESFDMSARTIPFNAYDVIHAVFLAPGYLDRYEMFRSHKGRLRRKIGLLEREAGFFVWHAVTNVFNDHGYPFIGRRGWR